jgi:hypothetical protein
MLNRKTRFAVSSPGAKRGSPSLKKVLFFCLLAVVGVRAETYREAYDIGYTDGVKVGREDRDRAGPFDFANNPRYQSADRGFDPAVHDRETYLVAYRRGFEDGYEEGYGLDRSPVQGGKAASTAAKPTARANSRDNYALAVGTEIQLRLLEALSTGKNQRGDPLRAEVLEEVLVGEEIAIPAGTKVTGVIAHLKRAGRIRGRSELNLDFHEIELPNGRRIPLAATVVSIEERSDEKVKPDEGTIQGGSGATGDVKRVGAATGIGALIGMLAGGGRGAKTGAAIGAAAGTAGVLATRGSDTVLYPGTELVIRLDREVVFPKGILLRSR